jgi:PIN domain nuclease of toxin-antitoxin system
VIVLDTHAWVWWMSNPRELSAKAKAAIDSAASARAVHISCISAWEVAMLVVKGRLELTMDVEDWVNMSGALPFMNFVPVDNHIAMRSTRLPGYRYRDPADRIIIATAIVLGQPVVTRDRKISSYPGVESVW